MIIQEGLMSAAVVRHHLYNTPEGNLRYTEHSPVSIHEDKQICNCTRSVAEKPPGEPSEVQQSIEFKQDLGKYRFDLHLRDADGPWFTLYWGQEHPDRWKESHAYFMSDVNGVKNNLNAEIAVPGYGRTGYFFGRVYFGNQVDTSRFMNGHAPSEIVDLSRIGPEQVWAHRWHWPEAMVVFRESEETRGWRQVKREVDRIVALAKAYNEDLASSVYDLRGRIEADQELLGLVSSCRDWFVFILDHLKTTELYRACDEVERSTKG